MCVKALAFTGWMPFMSPNQHILSILKSGRVYRTDKNYKITKKENKHKHREKDWVVS